MGAAWLRSIRTLKDLKSENGDNENRRVIFSSCTEKWHDNNVRSVEEQVKDRHSRIIEPGEIVLWTTLIPPFVKDYFLFFLLWMEVYMLKLTYRLFSF